MGSLIICASVVVHGVTATPLTKLYGRSPRGQLMRLRISENTDLRLSKVRMGGELVPCQVNKTAPSDLLWALHATDDFLSRALQRLSRQSLQALR